MIHFVVNELYENLVETERLETAALMVLASQEQDTNLGIVIMIETDLYLTGLNEQYRDIWAPTDVLSFGYEMTDPDTGEVSIGDIAISYERAEEQAAQAGHPVINELVLLVVHGVLHILGYDHAEPDEKERMWTVQAEILNQLGYQINRLPED